MRAIILAIALLATFAFAKGIPRWNELEGYTFEQYVNDFGKNYDKNTADYKKREMLFNERLREVKAHNADKKNTYHRGVNQFSDWSVAERKKLNTHRPSKYEAIRPQPTHTFRASGNVTLPKFVDYRTNTNPSVITAVKNQGACGNCWAFSATESVESYFALATGQLPVLSVQQITSCTTLMDGCGGGDMSFGWMYVQNSTGLNEEWLYPFVDFFAVNETKAATQTCRNITKDFLPNFAWWPKANVTGYARVESNDALATMEALATIGPQSISVAASEWMDYEGGIFKQNNSNPASWEIDHGVQLVGYGYDYGEDLKYWIVRNSWGTSWGEAGYIRLWRPDVEPCGVDIYSNQTICGTSGVISGPDHPHVTVLSRGNV